MSEEEHPMDEIERREAMKNLAGMARTFYMSCQDEGFASHEALRLTEAWIRGLSSGGAA